MALLDQYGRPVRTQQLTKELAEGGTTGVRRAWSDTVASGLTPMRLAAILRQADMGDLDAFLTLAEEMEERDPHYFSVLGTRKRAISGVTPEVKAASEDPRDEKIAEAVRENIAEHDGFPDLVEDMLDALGKGFSVTEINWHRSSREWVPDSFEHRPARFFTVDRETGSELRLLDEADRLNGVELEPFKFVVHKAKLKSGLAFRGGIARVVAFSWMCKAYDVKDWMAFVETYGLPLRLGRYEKSASKEDVQTLFRAVANIGTDAAAVLPKSMEIDFETAGTVTGDRLFENLARWCDEQVSKAVLGQTMTSDQGSSEAQAKVHDEVRHDIAVSDARAVSGTINRDLVKPFVDLNFGVPKRYPRLKLVVQEVEDIDMIMGHVDKLAQRGVTFKTQEVRSKLGFSDPDDDDEVIGALPKAPPPPATNTALNRADIPSDLMDEIEAEAMADWQDVTDDMLAPIAEIIETSSSYEEIERRLDELPGLPVNRMIDTLVKAMFKARSLGDVKDG